MAPSDSAARGGSRHPPELPAEPDVIVIGGGTAGAAAARLLATWGHLVVLLEREGTRAPLAESLPPSCVPLLETIGVRAAVEGAGFLRCTGNTAWWGGEPMRVETFPGGRLGFQVVRGKLEEVLGGRATAAGVVRVQPATVLRVDRESDVNVVDVALASGRHSLRAPWVLDCSGRAGVVARSHRVPAPDGVRTVALIDVWEKPFGWALPDESHTLVESATWGWGWSVPVTRERRFVTMMVDPVATQLTGDEGLAARYAELLASLPALGELSRGARCSGAPWAYEATPYHSLDVAFPGLLLVGDAASAIDPLSSYGVKKALASAWLAAVTVHTAFVSPEHAPLAADFFSERERAYVQSATQGLRGLSREAEPGGSAVPFWSARAELEGGNEAELSGQASVERLRHDPAVLAAFETLRQAPAIRLVPSDGGRRVLRPVVRGNVVVPEEHLVLPGDEVAVRYLRSVDLLALLDVASRHDDVGAMYAQFARLMGPIPLPDCLGALSVLVGKGFARLA